MKRSDLVGYWILGVLATVLIVNGYPLTVVEMQENVGYSGKSAGPSSPQILDVLHYNETFSEWQGLKLVKKHFEVTEVVYERKIDVFKSLLKTETFFLDRLIASIMPIIACIFLSINAYESGFEES